MGAEHVNPLQGAPPGRYVLDDQPGYLLRLAVQHHTAIFNRAMGEDLTPTQFAALSQILEVGTCSQSDLARMIELDTATVHGVVVRMCSRGYVLTSEDPIDRRRVILTLSPEGKAAIRRAHLVGSKISRDTLGNLSPREQARLLVLLRKMLSEKPDKDLNSTRA